MKLDELVHFARTHNVRAIAKGKHPSSRHTTYSLIVDTYTQPFADELERFEQDHNTPEIQILPIRDYFLHAYRQQRTEIWREAKLSPANIKEELVNFAKQHVFVKELRKGVHDEEGFPSWYFMADIEQYREQFFTFAPQLAELSRNLAHRGANVDVCYWATPINETFLGKKVWKRA